MPFRYSAKGEKTGRGKIQHSGIGNRMTVDLCNPEVYAIYGLQIGGDEMDGKRGRPTDNPKSQPIHIRMDAECAEILARYCRQENISRAEAIRRGIKRLSDEIKQK